MASKDKRFHVRAAFPFKVTYGMLSKEKYEKIRKTAIQFPTLHKKRLSTDCIDADKRDNGMPFDPGLVGFLLYLDEKLDKIIAMLSGHETGTELLDEGTGLNISASGMNLEVHQQVQRREIIHMNFVLSKFPLVFIDVFGEVVRVTPIEEGDKKCYRLGIKFLDLGESDREKVIACVFRKQREVIRERKKEDLRLEIEMK